MEIQFLIAIGLFVGTYAIIISEKIHRTIIALAGAMTMVIVGIINQEQAIEGIDFNTLGLLIGMMVIVGIAKDSGLFQYVAITAAKLGKGKTLPIFILLGIITATFSAFLDNVTTVLLLVPVSFVIANNLNINPKPILIAEILLANIGGTATLIGDPPNILIGSASGLTFNDFLVHLAPIAFLVGCVTIGLLVFWYRRELISSKEAAEKIMKFNPRETITDKRLLIKSLIVLGLVLVGFITHNTTHIEGATIALSGAALLLLLTLNDPEEHLREVEWTTIFFFVGLFVLVTGLEHVGAINIMAEKLLAYTGGNETVMTLSILWGSAIFSALIDNIPYVATMIPLVQEIGALTGIGLAPLWWALALGADIGGNATIVGASANVIVSGMAEKQNQRIGFMEYMKVAMPITFVGLVLCTIYVYFRYLI